MTPPQIIHLSDIGLCSTCQVGLHTQTPLEGVVRKIIVSIFFKYPLQYATTFKVPPLLQNFSSHPPVPPVVLKNPVKLCFQMGFNLESVEMCGKLSVTPSCKTNYCKFSNLMTYTSKKKLLWELKECPTKLKQGC